jgi:AcrR family transcriptional regulator
MGRPFNTKEKKDINKSLLKNGRDLYLKNGLKNTTVEELTQAAGIAQGSFYAFYSSKEELYFEILELEEEKIAKQIENQLLSLDMTRKNFKDFLQDTITLITGNPLLVTLLNGKDFSSLILKIPKEKYDKHLQSEYRFAHRLVNRFQEKGLMKYIMPDILSALLNSLFLLKLHTDEIGTDIFPLMFEFLIDMISDTLINNGTKNVDETGDKYWK